MPTPCVKIDVHEPNWFDSTCNKLGFFLVSDHVIKVAGKTKGAERVNPGSDPSPNPSSDPGSDPSSTLNSDPSSDPGSNPNSGPSSDPGSDPGSDPSSDPGSDPGSNPGSNPGSDPGSNPGSNPGSDPGSGSGSNPGSNPGSDPGSNSGFILSLSQNSLAILFSQCKISLCQRNTHDVSSLMALVKIVVAFQHKRQGKKALARFVDN